MATNISNGVGPKKTSHNSETISNVKQASKLEKDTAAKVIAFKSLAEIPVNFGASLIQAAKLLGKIIALPVTYTIAGIHKQVTKTDLYKGSMSVRGIAIDSIGLIRLITNIGVCYKRFLFPASDDLQSMVKDLNKNMKGTWLIIKGGLQEEKLLSCKQLFRKIVVVPLKKELGLNKPEIYKTTNV